MAKTDFQVYKNLTFPQIINRPFFYSNFVETIDGKVQVLTQDQSKYWPIGSKTDYQTLLELRAYADVLIHGKSTAIGHATVSSLSKPEFKVLRKRLGKNSNLSYIILTNDPDTVISYVKDSNFPVTIATTENANITNEDYDQITILRLGKNKVDIEKLSSYLYNKGLKNVLVEGGPNTLGEFFKKDLIDEIFVTIAPKIFGNVDKKTLTMVEGNLFTPDKVKKLKLITIKQVEDELYLRYRVTS